MESRSAIRWILPLCAAVGGLVAFYTCQPEKEAAVKEAGLVAKGKKGKPARDFKKHVPKKPELAGLPKAPKKAKEEPAPDAEVTWYSQDCTSCIDKECSDGDKEVNISEVCPPDDEACRAVLKCGIENKCITARLAAAACYCGTLSEDMVDCRDSTTGKDPDGPCREVFEKYSDSATPEEVMKKWYDLKTGLGRANMAAACFAERCVGSCVGQPGEEADFDINAKGGA